eukprot:TRINITY_DN17821_c0_g1_i1.p2 TRINITY_DN17821_c0_g1~~TRINITY_DN17821_c0_g1_i1.p2  ORF type:complete len:115 (-),score=14.28 TRINITY_DN17821_c0_g1_i1:2-346(-)
MGAGWAGGVAARLAGVDAMAVNPEAETIGEAGGRGESTLRERPFFAGEAAAVEFAPAGDAVDRPASDFSTTAAAPRGAVVSGIVGTRDAARPWSSALLWQSKRRAGDSGIVGLA